MSNEVTAQKVRTENNSKTREENKEKINAVFEMLESHGLDQGREDEGDTNGNYRTRNRSSPTTEQEITGQEDREVLTTGITLGNPVRDEEGIREVDVGTYVAAESEEVTGVAGSFLEEANMTNEAYVERHELDLGNLKGGSITLELDGEPRASLYLGEKTDTGDLGGSLREAFEDNLEQIATQVDGISYEEAHGEGSLYVDMSGSAEDARDNMETAVTAMRVAGNQSYDLLE